MMEDGVHMACDAFRSHKHAYTECKGSALTHLHNGSSCLKCVTPCYRIQLNSELQRHGIWVMHQISQDWHRSNLWLHRNKTSVNWNPLGCIYFLASVTCKTLWMKVSVRINDRLYFGLVCTRHLAVIQAQGAWPFSFSWRNSVSHFPESHEVFIQTESYSG